MSTSNISSPGIYINEIDQSFLAESIIQVGAALVGATARGPVEVPTVVTSYSEYTARFGELYDTGSDSYSFFNNSAAYSYFTNGGDALLITRVVNNASSYNSAVAEITNGAQGGTTTVTVLNQYSNALLDGASTTTGFTSNLTETVTGYVSGSPEVSVTADFITDNTGKLTTFTITSAGTYGYSTGDQLIFSTESNAIGGTNNVVFTLAGVASSPTPTTEVNGSDDIISYTVATGNIAFKVNTFAEGEDQNSSTASTKNNIKVEIKNKDYGTN